jgi:hypothetical protein
MNKSNVEKFLQETKEKIDVAITKFVMEDIKSSKISDFTTSGDVMIMYLTKSQFVDIIETTVQNQIKKYKIKNIKLINDVVCTSQALSIFFPNKKIAHAVCFLNKKIIYPLSLYKSAFNVIMDEFDYGHTNFVQTNYGYIYKTKIKYLSKLIEINGLANIRYSYSNYPYKCNYILQITSDNNKTDLFNTISKTRFLDREKTMFNKYENQSKEELCVDEYIDACEGFFLEQTFECSKILTITSLLSTSTFSSLNRILRNPEHVKHNKFSTKQALKKEKYKLFDKIIDELKNLEIDYPTNSSNSFKIGYNAFLTNDYILPLTLIVDKNKEKNIDHCFIEMRIKFSSPKNNKIYIGPHTSKKFNFENSELALAILQKILEYFKNNKHIPLVKEYQKKVKEIKNEKTNNLKNTFKQFENTKDVEYILMKVGMLYNIDIKYIKKVWEVSLDESN